MKLVIQRVVRATCRVDGQEVASIGHGLLVYVGFAPRDTTAAVDWALDRVYKMRIFEDSAGKMNLSVADAAGEVMWIPNFTLYCDAKSRRPSFSGAMPFSEAKPMFDFLTTEASKYQQNPVQCGIFGADMKIDSVADGPINVVVESPYGRD